MKCWCSCENIEILTAQKIKDHLKSLSFEDLVAHGTPYEEFAEWCVVRGITRDLRPNDLHKMNLYRTYRPVLQSAYFQITHKQLHIPKTLLNFDDLRNAATAVAKMRLNCEWANVTLPQWEQFYAAANDYCLWLPPELLRIIALFVGSFQPLNINSWRIFNGKRSFASDIHDYLNYYRTIRCSPHCYYYFFLHCPYHQKIATITLQ